MELNIYPTIKQHLAYQALKDKDVIFFGGGAGGGKSWWLCESRLINAVRFPDYRSFIGREELKRLMQSTYITWLKVCKHHKIPREMWKLNGQYNYIEFTNGSRIDLLDLKFIPSDPLYERFGSLEYTDGAIEEAGEVNFLAYDVLKTRIGRHKNDEFGVHPSLAISGNPKKNWTYHEFYKAYKNKTLPDNMSFIQSLYSDNPYTAIEYERQLSQIKDKVMKQRLMMGDWEYEEGEGTLIKYDAILDLFTNNVDKFVDKFITADIARFGKDKTVIILWNGYKVDKIIVLEQLDLFMVSEKIREIAKDNQVPFSHIIVDEDGVGGGVVDILRGIKGFVNNSVPLNKGSVNERENYRNLKTQCVYTFAEMANLHQIAINCPDMKMRETIIEELEQFKRKDPDKEGRLEVISKEEIKELIGRSPDFADALIMRMWFKLKGLGESLFTPQEKRISELIKAKQTRKDFDKSATTIF